MSDQLILPSLEIQGFRAFRKLEIGRLGRVNLIVGKNNAGKTSVLEALRLYANPSPRVLLELISTRDEFNQPRSPRPNGRHPSTVPIESLFHGRGADADRTLRISIGPVGAAYQTLLFELTSGEHASVRPGGSPAEDIDGGLPEGMRSVSFQIGPISIKPLTDDDLASIYQNEHSITSNMDIVTVPHVYVGSNGLDPRLAKRSWRNIETTESIKYIAKSLQMIDPRIAQAFADSYSADRLVPIVRLGESSVPITLRSMGDGMVRLFHLALALGNCTGGILLADEIENGLHYSVHEELWKFVFKTARDLNVQVFATTHSWDCIEAFQKAACEDESSEGYLIRLGWRRDEIVATVYDESDLAVVTRDHIEVR